MSGATIGGVVGGIVGAFFGAPQIGFMIGSMIGGAVDPEKFYGPRIGDGMQQTAAVGVPITYGWGTFPTAGNLMFDSGVREVRRKESAKGGPVTYTYHPYRSYAILICRAKKLDSGLFDPIAGVVQVKRNGKVVYNSLPGADSKTLAANSKFLRDHSFQLGGESQMPSSVIEQFRGAGNVPAHRDLVYMVADDVDLSDTNGAVPQYEFVVAMGGSRIDNDSYEPGRLSAFRNEDFPLAEQPANYTLRGYRSGEEVVSSSISGILEVFRNTYTSRVAPQTLLGYSSYIISSSSPAPETTFW